AELTARLLLQSTGREWSRWVALLLSATHRLHGVAGAFQVLNDGGGGGLVRQIHLPPVHLGQGRDEGARLAPANAGALGKLGLDRPVFDRVEGGDLALSLDRHAERGGLDAPGGKSAADFLPQQ